MVAGVTVRELHLGGGRVVAYPNPTTTASSKVMRANRARDTKPEVRLRLALHRRGLRFRKHMLIPTARRTVCADVVFTRRRLAVFVDGCFWHSCPDHGTRPAGNASYWAQKLDGNLLRDHATTEMLVQAGWQVVRVWEHTGPEDAADLIEATLGAP